MNTLNRQIAGKPGKDSAGCNGRLKVTNFIINPSNIFNIVEKKVNSN